MPQFIKLSETKFLNAENISKALFDQLSSGKLTCDVLLVGGKEVKIEDGEEASAIMSYIQNHLTSPALAN
jgi:hypothetical protein